MTPDINGGISDGRNLEKQIERQMGCMTGFLQLFDRNQILTGKRFNSAKRLPSFSTSGSLSPSERSDVSSTSFAKAAPPSPSSPSPGGFPSSPEHLHPARPSLPLPLPVFEVKNGVKTSWKLRETPRLSLDSRAVFDARGKLRPREIRTTPAVFSGVPSDYSDGGDDHDKHRRSPSVVARLMGLDALPVDCNEDTPKRSELRRSASESRVYRDLQFNFQKLSPNSEELFQPRKVDCSEFRTRNSKPEPPRALSDPPKRKSFFEAQEFFPEPKRTGSMYDEIEKRLRMRGIEEPAKDLETLKQILEALQLKGLLHAKLPELPFVGSLDVINSRTLPILGTTESPIILTKPKPKPKPLQREAASERLTLQHRSVYPRRPVAPEVIPPAKSLRDPVPKSFTRPPELNTLRSPISSPVRRRPVIVEGQISSLPERRISAVHPPVASPKRLVSEQIGLRSPRIRRPKPNISPKEKAYSLAEDAFSFSNTSILSPPSQFDFQRAGMEECRTGRSLLERCDKLLHSIAAITSSPEQVTATDQQPSPVSVLDSSFLSEENASPLPKPSIDFKDQIANWEDHRKHRASPSAGYEFWNGPEKEIGVGQGDDYAFVADVVRETDRRSGTPDLFSALEQRHCVAGASVLHRRHLFDTVTEIIECKRNVTPWAAFTRSPSTAFAGSNSSLLQEVWEEMRWLREHISTENVMELTGKVVRQDMAATAAGEQEWMVPEIEMSAAVLHIEQQLFKDLVADTIRELADLSGRRRATALPRRKLIF